MTFILSLIIILSISSGSFGNPPNNGRFVEIEQLIDDGWWYDAEARLAGMIKNNGNDEKAHYFLGYIYMLEFSMGIKTHWDEAEDHAKKAIELDGDDSGNHILLGNVMGLKAQLGKKLAAIGRAKKAKGSLEKAVKIDPENIEARNWLINFHINAPGIAGGNKDEARMQAEAIAKIDPVEGHYSQANICENLDKDPQKTENVWKTAIEGNPDDPAIYYRYAYFLQRQKRFDEAVFMLEQGAKLDPGSSGPAFDLGWIHEEAESWDDAIDQYEKLAEVDTTRQQAFMRLGSLYQKKESWDEALVSFEKAYETDPEHHYALYQVGRTCVLSESNLDRGEEAFRIYIKTKTSGFWPSRTSALWRLAMIYELKGERKKAVTALREGRKLDKGHKETKKMLRKMGKR